MTREEAIRILDPKTTGQALAEIEYYHGFTGKTAALHAVSDACEIAVAAIRRLTELESHSQALESNEPLTIEELRQMHAEPVWVKFLNKEVVWREDAWFILTQVSKYEVYLGGYASVYKSFEYYGKTWLAYRRQPEEEVTK